MKQISEYKIQKKEKKNERGEMLKYFVEKINIERESKKNKEQVTIPQIATRLTGFKLKDLYYLKSICDKAELEGKMPWAKMFYISTKT